MGRGEWDFTGDAYRAFKSRNPTKHQMCSRNATEALIVGGVAICESEERAATSFQDFLTDLMHYAHDRGWDWDDMALKARAHFETEMDLHERGEPHDGAIW